MRQNDLERELQRVPRHPDPKPDLEQVATPAAIAAEVLWRARGLGDVDGKRVLDLGCGTGVLAIGAILLGAERAVGVDVDPGALAVAARAAADLGVDDRLELVRAEVAGWEAAAPFDAAIQNPPFGAQERGADRPFLAAAVKAAPVVHTFHLTETGEFVIALARALGAELTHAWDYDYPIPRLFRHHTKAVQTVPVTVFRFVSK